MENIKICDTHNDFLTEIEPQNFQYYIGNCKRSGVETICSSYWSSKREECRIEEELLERTNALREADSNFLLHIEDLWWVKDEEKLEFLLKLKPFSCSLTWNDSNLLAGGTNGEGRLSEWGSFCLKKLTENGVIIDLAHLNRESFDDVGKLLKNNLYCSHTGFYGVKKHKRNLTDRQIEKIVNSDGFVGLFFFDKCLKTERRANFDVETIADNIIYFTSRWGFECLGIGSDFYGIEDYPNGLVDYADFGNLYQCLDKRGLTMSQIEKIFYKNFENFLSKIKNG